MHINHAYQRLRVFGVAALIAGCVIVLGSFNLQGKQQDPVARLSQHADVPVVVDRLGPLPSRSQGRHRLSASAPSQAVPATAVIGAAGQPGTAADSSTDLLEPAAALAADVSMNFGDVRQTIDGFGASDAWADSSGPAFTEAESDLFFSTQNGIGLSYLRLAIEADGSDSAAISTAQRAAARGARVWAAPWSAPASWKDNNDVNNGGHLCAAAGQGQCDGRHYEDWANRLAGFVSMMRSNGVDLYGLSVQNEPDWTAWYSSMLYTDREMVDFVKTLGPRLASLNPRPKLMVGEVASWSNIWSLANAIEADSVASSYTDIFAVHQYFGTSSFQNGRSRPLWQTEMSGFDRFDPGIDNAINVTGWINEALTTGNANAWHYWWLRGLNESNEGLVGHLSDMFAMTKRLFVMGNYSKFVRPGWVRIGTSGYAAGIDTIAFKNAATGEFAVVVTNRGSAATLTIGVSGATVQSQVTPYQTYDDGSGNFTLGTHGNLERRPPIDSIGGGGFTATVPHGVTTFVGVASTTQGMAPGAFSKTTPRNGATGQSTSLTSSSGGAPGTIDADYCLATTNTCVAWTGGGSATPVGRTTSLSLSWGAASGATSYEYCIDATNDNACSAWTSTGTARNVFVSGLSVGTWYYWHVRASNGAGTTYANGGSTAFWSFGTQFLAPGVSGNVDGNRKADLSAYRPSTGGWWILESSTSYVNYSEYGWDLPGDVPVPGDYDGDGKTDIAVYRPTTGGWWIARSSTNFETFNEYVWGVDGDVPVPADYDGDGKTDIAVFRPATGGWWILKSDTGFTSYVEYN